MLTTPERSLSTRLRSPTVTNSATGGPIANGPYRRATAVAAFTPGNNGVYMLQQMVPIADLGKTKATEPLDTQPKPAGAPQ